MSYALKIIKDIKKEQNKAIYYGPDAPHVGLCYLPQKSRPAGQTFIGISVNSPPLQSGEPLNIFETG